MGLSDVGTRQRHHLLLAAAHRAHDLPNAVPELREKVDRGSDPDRVCDSGQDIYIHVRCDIYDRFFDATAEPSDDEN